MLYSIVSYFWNKQPLHQVQMVTYIFGMIRK